MQNESATSGESPGVELPRATKSSRPPQTAFLKFLQIWNKLAPFFVSAALFLSGFFAIFAPLPFLILGVTGSPAWVVLAIATNSALVFYSSDATFFQFYLLAISSIGLFMPVLIRRRLKPEAVIAQTWVLQWCAIGLLVGVYAFMHHMTPLQEAKRLLTEFFDMMLASLTPESRESLIANFGGGEVGLAEWRRKTISELPGAFGILCLLVSWFNFRVLINLNPNRFLVGLGLDRRVLNRWKNAEWLVWPTLGSWAVVLFTEGTASDIALNVFKVLMAAYGIQGLAILASLFDAYRIRGLFRMLLYCLVLVVMVPLLLSIGFFDQWFDFRAKFRQS